MPPCAVPVDPRHRLVVPKYNPARTYTPEGSVGIGGAYMCIVSGWGGGGGGGVYVEGGGGGGGGGGDGRAGAYADTTLPATWTTRPPRVLPRTSPYCSHTLLPPPTLARTHARVYCLPAACHINAKILNPP